jgi:hypothetical protein
MRLKTGEEIICLVTYGSHLYGTATETSDKDFRGIFMPSKWDLVLNKKLATKKDYGEEDTEYFPLHKFIDLALQGQTIALDMLFAPEELTVITSPLWERMKAERESFLFKEMNAFVGYARAQAKKYSAKGDRLAEAESLIELLDETEPDVRMSDIWNKLPLGLYLEYINDDVQGIPQYRALNRTIKSTYKVGYVREIMSSVVSEYGKRAKRAYDDKGADWKALSHAVRISLELLEIYRDKKITFPIKKRGLVLKIKRGEIPLSKVINLIDKLVEKVEVEKDNSGLPDKPDTKFWEEFLYVEIMNHLMSSVD